MFFYRYYQQHLSVRLLVSMTFSAFLVLFILFAILNTMAANKFRAAMVADLSHHQDELEHMTESLELPELGRAFAELAQKEQKKQRMPHVISLADPATLNIVLSTDKNLEGEPLRMLKPANGGRRGVMAQLTFQPDRNQTYWNQQKATRLWKYGKYLIIIDLDGRKEYMRQQEKQKGSLFFVKLTLLLFALFEYMAIRKHIIKPVGSVRDTLVSRMEGDTSAYVHLPWPDELGKMGNDINQLFDRYEAAENSIRAQAGELQLKAMMLAQARDEAEQSNKLKSEFLASMSHEIRTPMNAMLGFADLLLMTELNETQKRYASTIVQSTNDLLEIINDILDLAKVESGRIELENIPLDLKEMLENIGNLFSLKAKEKNIDLQVRCNLPDSQFTGDATRIRQILMNLVGNALKFTPKGYVRLTSFTDGRDVCFTVEDTGIGIPEDKKAQIFDAFSQADASTTRQYGGTGLGLSICKRLATLMGGNITVDSTPGQGTTFTVKLALAGGTTAGTAGTAQNGYYGQSLEEIPVLAENRQPEETEIPDLQGLRILVAEDNRVNQSLIQAVFSNMGIIPVFADDGQLAIEAILKEPFDLVLMDGRMPVMDGYEATRRIRAMHELGLLPWLPVFGLTANTLPEQINMGKAAGMDEVITKPLRIQELINFIRQYNIKPATAQEDSNTDTTVPEEVAATEETGELSSSYDSEIPALTPEEEKKAPAPSLLQLDILHATRSMMGNKWLVMVEFFEEDGTQYVNGMTTAAGKEDWAELVHYAHTLKSSSRSVGAIQLACHAEMLERRQYDNPEDRADIELQLQELHRLFDGSCQELKTLAPDTSKAA